MTGNTVCRKTFYECSLFLSSSVAVLFHKDHGLYADVRRTAFRYAVSQEGQKRMIAITAVLFFRSGRCQQYVPRFQMILANNTNNTVKYRATGSSCRASANTSSTVDAILSPCPKFDKEQSDQAIRQQMMTPIDCQRGYLDADPVSLIPQMKFPPCMARTFGCWNDVNSLRKSELLGYSRRARRRRSLLSLSTFPTTLAFSLLTLLLSEHLSLASRFLPAVTAAAAIEGTRASSKPSPQPAPRWARNYVEVSNNNNNYPPLVRELQGAVFTPSPTRLVTWGEREKSLLTTFNDDNGNYGAVFTIKSTTLDVSITTLEFNTDSTTDVGVKVYTRPGEFNKTEMATPDQWDLASDTSVRSAGAGLGTIIPEQDFTPVIIPRNEYHTFYITLATKSLRYTNASTYGAGDLYISDKFLEVYVGKGVGEPFLKSTYGIPPRVFNGVLHYITEVDNTTQSPTPAPVSPWIDTFQIDQSLETTASGGSLYYGCIFEIRALSNVVIRSLDLRIDETHRLTVEVWTKPDTYAGFVSDQSAWSNVVDVTLKGGGQGAPSQITSDNFDDVAIPSGSVQSFFVMLQSPVLELTDQATQSRGDVYTSDANIEVLVGEGVGSYGFVNNTVARAVFNGVVHYSVDSTSPPSSAPTSAPTPQLHPQQNAGLIVSQQLIQIAGVSDTRLRQLTTVSYDGRLLLNTESIDFFQSVAASFLGESVKSSHITISNVIVSPDISPDQVTVKHARRTRGRLPTENEADWKKEGTDTVNGDEFQGNMTTLNETDATDDAVHDGNSSQSSENETSAGGEEQHTLNLYTTIAGDYNPPPYVDFDVLVSDSFNDKGEVSSKRFLTDLKQDKVFEEATGVKSTSVEFPLPASLMQKAAPGGLRSKTLYIIYGCCGFIVVLIVGLFIAMECRKRRKSPPGSITIKGESSGYSQSGYSQSRSSRYSQVRSSVQDYGRGYSHSGSIQDYGRGYSNSVSVQDYGRGYSNSGSTFRS